MAFCSFNSLNRISVYKPKVTNNNSSIVNADTSIDYVAYISMNTTSWIPNTTRDVTGTYTLFSDNVSMTNDATRGYVINTIMGNGNYGIRLESPAVINWIPSYTYSVWVNVTSALATQNHNGIVGDYLGSAGSFFLYWDNNGLLTCTHGPTYYSDLLTGPTFSTLNVWNHITISYNNSTLLMTMYFNGVSVASKTKSGSWTGFGSSTGGKMCFGFTNMGGVSKSFTGYIDNMRVYGRVLTSTEVSHIYNYEKTYPTLGYFVTPLPTAFTAGTLLSSSLTISSYTGVNAFRNGTYIVSSDAVFVNSNVWGAFNCLNGSFAGDQNNCWLGSDGATTYMTIQLPFSCVSTYYSLLPWHSGTYSPTEWYVYGSTDGTTWTTLDHQTSGWTYYLKTFTFTNTVSYSYYKLTVVTTTNGYNGVGQFNIGV